MDCRRIGLRSLAAAMFAAAVLAPASGCREIATTVAYVFVGDDADVDFPGLQGKKVVVVCRPLASLQYRDVGASKEVARRVADLLQKNVSKIKVVSQQKVAEWTDENMWDEYPEVGKALGADVVVGIDLTSFSTNQGPTLYQGKATASVKVFDLKDDNKIVYEKDLPQIMYPPNIGIPISDKSEADFRRDFTGVLAYLIARQFYAYDSHDDTALDAKGGLN